MANLTRNLFVPLVDANTIKKAIGDTVAENAGFDWTRIDKSTVFALAFNPQENTRGFIDEANDTTYVDSYQPELPQEIILDSANPLFKVMYPFCMAMPTGSNAIVPVLLVEPNMDTAEPTEGRLWKSAIISPTDLNTVDGKLSFSLKLNGSVERGTVALSDGAWTFTPASEAAPQTYSLKGSGSKNDD